jgi:hypothetical protein
MRVGFLILWGVIAASPAGAAIIEENFSSNPATNGWILFGQPGLFHWNSTNQNVEVTWDSSQSNSYFYHPLGMILTSNDEFSLEFDLQLNDAQINGTGFEIAVGLFNSTDATRTNFFRGSGHDSPNLFEFDYFPDFGFGPSIDGTLTDVNSRFRFAYDNLPLDANHVYHVVLNHASGALFLSGEVFQDDQLYTSLPISYFQPPVTNFTDFHLDAISISSYKDTGSGGSILAHGVVDNILVTAPSPIQNLTGTLSNGVWFARFLSRSNWLYTLERTADFQSWTNILPVVSGNGTTLTLPDFNPPSGKAFYRVRANRP